MKNTTLFYILILISFSVTNSFAQNSEKNKKTAEVLGGVITGVAKEIFKGKKDKTDKSKNKNSSEKPIDATKMSQELVLYNLFGSTKTDNNKEVVWKLKEGVTQTEVTQNILSYDNQFHTNLDNIYYFDDNGKESAAAVFFTYRYNYSDYDKKVVKETCRACSAALGVVVYQKNSDGTWKSFNSSILSRLVPFSASSETKPEYEFKKIGENLSVLAFKSDYGMGGQFTMLTEYISLDNTYFLNSIFSFENSDSLDDFSNEKNSYVIIKEATETTVASSPYKAITLKVKRNNKTQPDEIYTFSETEGRYIKKETAVAKKTPSKSAPKTATKKTTTPKTVAKTKTSETKPKPSQPANGKVKSTGTIKMD